MKIADLAFARGFMRMTYDAYLKGWHERNGGNLSYRMTGDEAKEAAPLYNDKAEWKPCQVSVPDLGGEHFLVTGTGRYMRNIKDNPDENICILKVDEKGENYKMLWGLTAGGGPTSELPSHLMNHQVKKRATAGKNRVIYHAHPANLVALTFILPLEDKVFSRELWEGMTECPMIFPEGVGVLPWMVPGGRDIAIASAKLMEKYNAVVWAQHGLFVAGSSFDEAFGLMEAIEKSAEISVKVRSMAGGKKRQTITSQNLRDLWQALHLPVNEAFLD
jgi:rhamnulose-1-phosphate aldolase